MHSFGLLNVAFALTVSASFDPALYEWSYEPEKTTDWYKSNGFFVPDTAPTLTEVKANKSYVVKLECLGCPFRVRQYGELVETWQEPPRGNSLLLNFTVDDSQADLLLNGERIAPIAPLPLAISAYQTPTNLSDWILEKMVKMHMLDSKAWNVGTRFGKFELEYEHIMLAQSRGREWLQFDVMGIHILSGHNTGSANVDKEGQRLVQLLLHREMSERGLVIEEIQIVERKDRAKPIKMSCGKYAILQTKYNPLEWDYYGKFGTWTRTWHLVLWKSEPLFVQSAPVLILTFIILTIVKVARWRQKQSKGQDTAPHDDAEAALLAAEHAEVHSDDSHDAVDAKEREQ